MAEILNHSDFDKLYQLIENSFPKNEYRSYEEQKELLNNSAYNVYTLYSPERAITAIITVWDFGEFAFIEHFAVDPNDRNSGIGSKMLKEVSEKLNKMICLEVELPENEIACRRIKFYERNNFFLNEYKYVQPSLSKGEKPVPMYIMTYKNRISKDEFNNIRKIIYKKVYKQNSEN